MKDTQVHACAHLLFREEGSDDAREAADGPAASRECAGGHAQHPRDSR